MKRFRIKREIKRILENSKSKLTEDDVVNVNEFIKYGELGIAFELICVQLYEHGNEIDQCLYDSIESLGKYMRISSDNWECLEENITRT